MSDLYCVKCGEPTDQEELHYIPGKTYAESLAAFQSEGCAGIDMTCNMQPAENDRAYVASALYDLLGDDIDCMDDMMDMAGDFGFNV